MVIDLDEVCTLANNREEFRSFCKLPLYSPSTYPLSEFSTISFGYSSSWFRSKPTVGAWPNVRYLSSKSIQAYRLPLLVDYNTGMLVTNNKYAIQSYGDKQLFSQVFPNIQSGVFPFSSQHSSDLPVFIASARWAQTNYFRINLIVCIN